MLRLRGDRTELYAESAENYPHLAPKWESVAELDQELPHLAQVNSENWTRMCFKPTVSWKEHERQRQRAKGAR